MAIANDRQASTCMRLMGQTLNCVSTVVALTLVVIAILNLQKDLSDFTTGAIYVGGAGVFTVHLIYDVINTDDNNIDWRDTLSKIFALGILLIVPGALGLTGILQSNTLGWSMLLPCLAVPFMLCWIVTTDYAAHRFHLCCAR